MSDPITDKFKQVLKDISDWHRLMEKDLHRQSQQEREKADKKREILKGKFLGERDDSNNQQEN